MSIDIWPIVHAERAALAADLKTLPDADAWNTPSLCAGWTVQDVLAHMTATAGTTPVSFLVGLAGSGFSFARFVGAGIARERGANPQETLDRFEAQISSTKAPPGPKPSWLGETIVHAEDIRHPLGLERTYPVEALVALADFYKKSNTLIGAKSRIADVALQATDALWGHGSGALVEGPILALVTAMTGRKAYLDQLSGPGVATLRSRD
ncbi:MAG: maleylpyruvate isomerase family mycothiol-dependent enzyme [Dermatophilaceae bacterium]